MINVQPTPPKSDAKAIFWTLTIILVLAMGLSPQFGVGVLVASALFLISIPLIMVCGFAYLIYQAIFNSK